MRINKILILGTGAWGSAIAKVLFDNKQYIKMYGISQSEINDLKKGYNKKFFSGKLGFVPNEVSDNLESLIYDVDYIVFCTPSLAIEGLVKLISPYIKQNMILINTSKGLLPNQNIDYFQFLEKNFPKNTICSIVGPSFAKELVKSKHTCINLLTNNKKCVNKILEVFNNDYFKLIYCSDNKGCNLLSSFKNVIAIASGLMNGMNLSINTTSAIISIAIKEATKLTKLMNGNEKSIVELSGIGDIILTTNSITSRNYYFGTLLAKYPFTKAKSKAKDLTIEGINTTSIIYKFLMKKKQIDNFPFFSSIYKLINGRITANRFIELFWKNL